MAGRKTSNKSWKAPQNQTLPLPADGTTIRLAILGVGNELSGDDAVGLHIARRLIELHNDQQNLLVLECGQVPENAGGPLRKFQPDLVILVDAADMGRKPGTIDILDPHQTAGFSASSHTLPLSVFAGFIENEFGSPVVLCAIQPASLEFAADLTEPVRKAADRVVKEITFWIDQNQPPAQ